MLQLGRIETCIGGRPRRRRGIVTGRTPRPRCRCVEFGHRRWWSCGRHGGGGLGRLVVATKEHVVDGFVVVVSPLAKEGERREWLGQLSFRDGGGIVFCAATGRKLGRPLFWAVFCLVLGGSFLEGGSRPMSLRRRRYVADFLDHNGMFFGRTTTMKSILAGCCARRKAREESRVAAESM
jgi:hypothetical protein